MALVLGISPDFFNGALHKALLERIYEKGLSGSGSKPEELTVFYRSTWIVHGVGFTTTTLE